MLFRCWLLIFICAITTAFPSIVKAQNISSVGSPEEISSCNANTICTPVVAAGQNRECLSAQCIADRCVTNILAGKVLSNQSSAPNTGCYLAPLVCDERGHAVPSTDQSLWKPTRQGEACTPEGTLDNQCQQGICQGIECVIEDKEDGTSCSDPGSPISPCHRAACLAGSCKVVMDVAQIGKECAAPIDGTCITSLFACSPEGVCQPTDKLREGAECAPPDLLAPQDSLPEKFRALLMKGALDRQISCDPNSCRVRYCGNGIIEKDLEEACDSSTLPADAPAGARCNSDCKLNFCGDGIIDNETGEQCDGTTLPPGSSDGVVCNSSCKFESKPFCGDGIIQTDRGEKCDGASLPGDAGPLSRCLPDCSLARCGDGVVNGGEECDSGGAAPLPGATRICNALCQLEFCGDGRVNNDLGEECDGARIPSTAPAGARCNAACKLEFCGDGKISPNLGEQCDGATRLANAPEPSVCDAACKLHYCGDGVISEGEECDGKNIPTNAPKPSQCNAQCKLEYCGDGIINAGLGEQCDGEARPPYALTVGKCDRFCRLNKDVPATCGDGVVDEGEECDGEANPGWECKDCELECVSPYRLAVYRWDPDERSGGAQILTYWHDELESCMQYVLGACHSDNTTQSRMRLDGTLDPLFTALEGTKKWEDDYFADDCVARYFLGHGISHGPWNLDWNALGWHPDGPPCKATAAGCSYEETAAWEEKRNEIYGSTSIYVTKECKIVEKSDYTCADFGMQYIVSPVSLIWDSSVRVSDIVAFSQFALNPREQGRWFVWRASDKTPLVVHDPKRTGKVVGADQLFGNFTFGKTWKNGFDALASLDKNGDGVLKDSELAELSLWFDKNSDGVSDPGEVRPLQQEGVTSLSTRFNREDSKFGDLHSDQGYERHVDGKVIVGSSVDWYAAGFSSKMEAIANLEKLTGDRVETAQRSDNAIRAQLRLPLTTEIPAGVNLSGSWVWEVTGDKAFGGGTKPKGALVIKDKSGDIFGHSLMEVPLQNRSGEIQARMTMVPLSGKRTTDPYGRTTLSFTIKAPDGGITTTEAILSADKTTLEGKTITEIMGTREASGKRGSFSYSWTARRHIASQKQAGDVGAG